MKSATQWSGVHGAVRARATMYVQAQVQAHPCTRLALAWLSSASWVYPIALSSCTTTAPGCVSTMDHKPIAFWYELQIEDGRTASPSKLLTAQ